MKEHTQRTIGSVKSNESAGCGVGLVRLTWAKLDWVIGLGSSKAFFLFVRTFLLCFGNNFYFTEKTFFLHCSDLGF
jgi:hypothetical protein